MNIPFRHSSIEHENEEESRERPLLRDRERTKKHESPHAVHLKNVLNLESERKSVFVLYFVYKQVDCGFSF